MFVYDPKTKQKLPFYDTFQLVLPIDTFRYFYMLKLSLSPLRLRYKLLDQLQFSTNSKV